MLDFRPCFFFLTFNWVFEKTVIQIIEGGGRLLNMNKKLYVGNLDYGVNDAQLADLFAQAGTVVSVTVIVDRYTNRSKGFAFVEMSTDEEAKKAIEMFNNQEFQGRTMVVNEARPKVEDKPQAMA